MKLNTTTNTIERIGNVSNEAQFRMKTSQKAFQILSDLYSDKPLAIVRELGCNAADSMTAAGKTDQPFHIHLPNSLEPWLAIEDFGTGISHDDIYDIYTVYFASTKTNSNSQIGCLGLGSKSPFCYTDNFSVTSTHGGVRRIYNAYFNESGTPAIALMSTENSDALNGVKIQIPIKNTDFGDFTQAVEKSFRFFDVKPTITGGKIQWSTEVPLFSADDWAFYEKNADKYHGESFAIMGGVTYPIDQYKIRDCEQADEMRQLLRNGLVLKFAMGELDFTPARDALSYTPETINAISDKLQKVMTELPIKITEIIDKKDTLLEAIRAALFFKDKFFFLNTNRIGVNKGNEIKITWKGIDITEPIGFFKKLAPDLQLLSKRSWHRRKLTVSTQPQFGSDVEWFYDDLNRGGERRVRAYIASTGKSAMIFDSKDYDNLIANNFSVDMFQKVSSLPSPTVQRKVRSNGTVVQKAKEDITIYNFGEMHKEKWDSEVIEPSENLPKYYFVKETDGWGLKLKLNGIRVLSTKGELASILTAFGISRDEVCMVSSREEKKIIQRGGCKNLATWWNANIKVEFDANELKTLEEYEFYHMDNIIGHKKFKDLDDSNSIKVAINTLKTLKAKYVKIKDVSHYLENFKNGKKVKFPLTEAEAIVFDFIRNCGHYDCDKYMVLAKALEK
jgi:hypothetical protein